MPRLTKEQRLQDVHARMLERFDRVWSTQRDERIQSLEDRRFYIIAGAMWEGAFSSQFENLPKLEMNKIAQAIMRIEGDYRQSRLTVRFRADPVNKVQMRAAESAAESANALFRADARKSPSAEAFDNAFVEGVGGGMGGARVRAVKEYPEDQEDKRQRLCIEPIFDADSRLFFDDNAKLATTADARWGFVITPYIREAYIAEFDDDPATWPIDTTLREFDWCTPDYVFVAEYYELESKKTEMVIFTHISGLEERFVADELDEDDLRRLRAVGALESRRYNATVDRCMKYIANGARVLEDCGRIPGRCIPLIPFYAQRQVVDGVERFRGHVRTSKDAARLKNMMMSKLAEISSGNIQERPVFYPEQIAGHQTLWAEDNIKRNPYLLINPMINKRTGEIVVGGPVTVTKPPSIPQSLAALLELSEMDMKDMLGSQEQAEKLMSNVSENTVLTVQQRLDQRTFIYMSNFQSFVERVGQVWLSGAKEIYVEEGRTIEGVTEDDQTKQVRLKSMSSDPKAGVYLEGDIESFEMNIVATFGPSTSTRRAGTVRQIREMLPEIQDPEVQSILTSIAVMNLDGEAIDDIRPFLRKKLIAQGVLRPSEEERKEMEAEAAGKPEDPQAQYLRAAAEEAVANAIKRRAETIRALAQAQKETVEAAATAESIGRDDLQMLNDVITSTAGQIPSGQPASPIQSPSV